MAKLKVFACNIDGTREAVVAESSQKAAAAKFGISVNHLRDYGGVTGNAKQIEVAMSDPGSVFVRSTRIYGSEYTMLRARETSNE